MPASTHLLNASLTAPPIGFEAVTLNQDIGGGTGCRALIVDADGTVDVVMVDGSTMSGLLVFKGRNSGFFKKVTAKSGPTVIQAAL